MIGPRKIAVFALFGAFAVMVPGLARTGEDWLMYRGNPGRTGVASDEPSMCPPFEVQCAVQLKNPGEGQESSPAVLADGRVLAVSGDMFYVISPDCKVLGSVDIYGGGSKVVRSSPAYDPAGGRAFVGSSDGNLYAIDIAPGVAGGITGTKAIPTVGGAGIDSSPLVVTEDDGVYVYITDDGGRAYKYNAGTLAQVWATMISNAAAPQNQMDMSPTSVDGLITVGDRTGQLYGVRKSDGGVAWTFDPPFYTCQCWGGSYLGTKIDPYLVTAAYDSVRGQVYYGGVDSGTYSAQTLFAVKVADGTCGWYASSDNLCGAVHHTNTSSVADAANGLLYNMAVNNDLAKLNASNRAFISRRYEFFPTSSSPVLFNDRYLAYGRSWGPGDYGLVIVDVSQALMPVVASFKTWVVSSSPAVAHGRIYVRDNSGKLYVIRTVPSILTVNQTKCDPGGVDVRLEWTVPGGAEQGEEFLIYRSLDPATLFDPASLISTVTGVPEKSESASYTDVDGPAGMMYYGVASSRCSRRTNVVTIELGELSPVTGLLVEVKCTGPCVGAALTWPTTLDCQHSQLVYKVYRWNPGAKGADLDDVSKADWLGDVPQPAVVPGTMGYCDPGIISNQNFCYRVLAVASDPEQGVGEHNAGLSPAACVTDMKAENLKAEAVKDECDTLFIRLTWNPPTGVKAVSYSVYRSEGGNTCPDFHEIGDSAMPKYLDDVTALPPGNVLYRVTMVLANGQVTSLDASDTVTISTSAQPAIPDLSYWPIFGHDRFGQRSTPVPVAKAGTAMGVAWQAAGIGNMGTYVSRLNTVFAQEWAGDRDVVALAGASGGVLWKVCMHEQSILPFNRVVDDADTLYLVRPNAPPLSGAVLDAIDSPNSSLTAIAHKWMASILSGERIVPHMVLADGTLLVEGMQWIPGQEPVPPYKLGVSGSPYVGAMDRKDGSLLWKTPYGPLERRDVETLSRPALWHAVLDCRQRLFMPGKMDRGPADRVIIKCFQMTPGGPAVLKDNTFTYNDPFGCPTVLDPKSPACVPPPNLTIGPLMVTDVDPRSANQPVIVGAVASSCYPPCYASDPDVSVKTKFFLIDLNQSSDPNDPLPPNASSPGVFVYPAGPGSALLSWGDITTAPGASMGAAFARFNDPDQGGALMGYAYMARRDGRIWEITIEPNPSMFPPTPVMVLPIDKIIAPPVVSAGQYLVGGSGSTFGSLAYVYDLQSGSLPWGTIATDRVTRPAAIGPDGNWYVIDFGGTLYAIDPARMKSTGPLPAEEEGDLPGPESLAGPVEMPHYMGTIGGPGTAEGGMRGPRGVASAGTGTIAVADSGNNRVQLLKSDGTVIRVLGRLGKGPGNFRKPSGVAVASGPAGLVYVADTGNDRVQVLTAEGDPVKSIGRSGAGKSEFDSPAGVAADETGNIYVADTGNDRVQVFTSDGEYAGEFGKGDLTGPAGIAVDGSGLVYVADGKNGRIQAFSAAGSLSRTLDVEGAGGIAGLAFGPDGALYAGDPGRHRIIALDPAGGRILGATGTYGTGPGELDSPRGLGWDLGARLLYVADTGNDRVQVLGYGAPPTLVAGGKRAESLVVPEGFVTRATGRTGGGATLQPQPPVPGAVPAAGQPASPPAVAPATGAPAGTGLTLGGITVAPNPYYPAEGVLTISYTVNRPARISVVITDKQGKEAWRLAEAGSAGAAWDGKTVKGTPAHPGAYLVTVVASDGAGVVQSTVEVAVGNRGGNVPAQPAPVGRTRGKGK